ncbi:uncharacterized protein LOC141850436 isoform X1 [Brevipalpus obovatus]|uniref:uncharacterized protein LOC141850436 isoform X1 n=1 Tax=Brevipalpus obovatus TaxID=246614 RepID=UPI003D9F440A
MQNIKTRKPEPNKQSLRGPAALVQLKILELITKCPLNVDRFFMLKSAIIYELSKSSDDRTHQLAKEILRKWNLQSMAKNTVANSAGPKQVDSRKPLSSKGITSQSNAGGTTILAKKRQQDENVDVRSKASIDSNNQASSSHTRSKEGGKKLNGKNGNNSRSNGKNLSSQVSNIRSSGRGLIYKTNELSGNDKVGQNSSPKNAEKAKSRETSKEKSAETLGDNHTPINLPTTIIEKVLESADDGADDHKLIPGDKEKIPGNVSVKTSTKIIPEPVDHCENSSDSIVFIEEIQPAAKSTSSTSPKRSASSLEFSGRLNLEKLDNSDEQDMKRMKKENITTASIENMVEPNTDENDIEMPKITPISEDKISFIIAQSTSSADKNSAASHIPESSCFEARYWMKYRRSTTYEPRRTIDYGASPYYYRRSFPESRKDSHADYDQDDKDMHHCFKNRCSGGDDTMHNHMPRCECPAYHMMKFMNKFMTCHQSTCGKE